MRGHPLGRCEGNLGAVDLNRKADDGRGDEERLRNATTRRGEVDTDVAEIGLIN